MLRLRACVSNFRSRSHDVLGRREHTIAQRAFILLALPVLAVMVCGFFLLDRVVRAGAVRELSQHLASAEATRHSERVAAEARLQRTLSVLADSAGLKAGILLHRELEQSGALRDPAQREQAAETLRAQVAGLRAQLSFDQYILADGSGQVLAAQPASGQFDPAAEILENRGEYFRMVTVPVHRDNEAVGYLSVGSRLDFSPASGRALLRNGKVVASAIPGLEVRDSAREVEFGGRTYVAHYRARGAFTVVDLAEVDSSVAPLLSALRTALLSMATASILLCLGVSFVGTRELSRPLRELSGSLAEAGRQGVLPSTLPDHGSVVEMRHFVNSLRQATLAVTRSREELDRAYVHFMAAMAEALDARDAYTAGHSRRVADYSVSIARKLGLPPDQVERVRVGAMLHDIGKIGVPDRVLLKHERLTPEEFATIQTHPVIGRRILERISRFEPYLAAVELHHENHDGTGYPHGLAGEAIPIDARVIHVADAYDAMTSNRPYRQRMPEDKVRQILRECSGTQFDPRAVEAFLSLPADALLAISNDLEKLSHAITSAQGLGSPELPVGAVISAGPGS